MLRWLASWLSDDRPSVGRSSHWPRVRDEHLAGEPRCRACGAVTRTVHHIRPVHRYPELECCSATCDVAAANLEARVGREKGFG